ncbi:FxsC protein [Actinoplanes sp. NBC_00393]|uniref:FxsC protein n=1 Tax=Actinoplanes sp. NBC_00393 TaxID=2975953 RepID=UPI002E21EFAA
MTYFFLSHAPGEDEPFVKRFFADLSDQVSRRAGRDSSGVGFLDSSMLDGPQWPADAHTAITTCQTFIALCSRRYFLSDRCGRAWGIFADRVRRHEIETGVRAPALIPVIWSGGGLPNGAFHGHGVDVTPHHAPGGEDLRVLLRLRRNHTAYRAFVTSLAHRVVDVAHKQRLPSAPPGTNLESAENAFHWDEGEHPQRVYFVVVAGTRQQMREVRRDVQFYGDRGEDWAPFCPTVPEPIAEHACGVAADQLLGSEVVSAEGMPQYVAAARERNEIVVLLVDAWATRLTELRQALQDLAQRQDADFAVLVPANGEDTETVSQSGELRKAMARAFDGSDSRPAATLTMDIRSMEGFDKDLGRVLADARHRIYRTGRVFRRPVGSRGRQRPILGGP